ncbi:PEGA domain-containing protein [bacterium]|nr:PEGA domain-containing protein [bacterium]MBU1065897.1 PEGA domain-containing protein [bacterium]MBU1632933.1 PEGA domain-containing protein [bacterium]MBU1873380.1 PEGA domain-containing protein [bacterium]
MKKIFNNIIIITLALLTSFNSIIARQSDNKNLAVFPFAARGMTDIEAYAISDRIRNEFAQSDQYTILERGMMEEILKEQAFQLSGACSESSCLVEAGQLLAVHYIAGGSVTKVGNLFTIEARIVDVESGKIVKNVIEDYMGPIENLLVYTTKTVVQKLLGVESGINSIALIGKSDLLVKSNPPGGTIYINDKPIGDVTPYTIQGLSEGEIRVKVQKDNLVSEKLVSIGINEIKEIGLDLEPEKFTLRVYSEPSGANVSINDLNIGQTPLDFTILDTTNLFMLKLSKAYYMNFIDTVRFSEKTLQRLYYTLQPCGQINIIKVKDTDIYLNKTLILSKNKQIMESNFQVIYSFISNKITIDQLEIREYEVWINKEYFEPITLVLKMDKDDRIKMISPQFQRKEIDNELLPQHRMEGGILVIRNDSIPANIQIIGNQYKTDSLFQPNQIEQIDVPFDNYRVIAQADNCFIFDRSAEVFSSTPVVINISFDSPKQRNAIIMSSIMPGFGQLYSLQDSKGGIFLISSWFGVVWAYNSVKNYNVEKDNYDELTSLYNSSVSLDDLTKYQKLLTDSKENLDSHKLQLSVALSLTGIIYITNLIDICFFYPSVYHQNISFNFNPIVNYYEVSYHF